MKIYNYTELKRADIFSKTTINILQNKKENTGMFYGTRSFHWLCFMYIFPSCTLYAHTGYFIHNIYYCLAKMY